MPAKINEQCADRISTICIILLGGINPEALKKWYPISDREISQARRKIELLREVRKYA